MNLALEFPGASEVASLMRAKDWSESILDTPDQWPLSLKTVTRLILNSTFPMFVAWGPKLGFLYNDAYAQILGNKHPSALGAPFKQIWQEIWQDISPIIDKALQGESSFHDDLELIIERSGYPETAWFTFSYSPLYGDDGAVAGMYCSVIETTKLVRARHLREFQLSLADKLHPLTYPEEIVHHAVSMLAAHLSASGCWYAQLDSQSKVFNTWSGWLAVGQPPIPLSGNVDDYSPALVPELLSGNPVIINDVYSDPRTSATAERFGVLNVGSILIIPLLKSGELEFSVNVIKPVAYVWTNEDVEAAKDVLHRTWTAMENAVTQKKLIAERGKSDYILNQMNEGFMVVDQDQTISRINAEGLFILGRPAEAVLRRPFLEVWPVDIRDRVMKIRDRVLRTSEPDTIELTHRAADKNSWLEMRINPVATEGLAVFFRDITQQKEAGLALRRSEEHLASLFEQTAAGIAERDLTGRIIRVNQRFCQMLGQSREELIGVDIHDLTHPDDLPRSEAAFKKLLADGKPFDIQKRYIRSGGSAIWVSTTVSLIESAEGTSARSVLAVIIDITERKRAEEALQDETRILELLNHSGQSLASTLDLNTLLQTVTDSGRALTGAEFAAFFYNGQDEQGDAYVLYTLSGAPREAFDGFGHPRATPVFKPTFIGGPPIRSDDIMSDPRYGTMAPHHGMPKGHLPVRSYLAASVISRSGDVIGGLFFGHSKTGMFSERSERLITGLAAQAAIAIDNARLYELANKAAEERQTLLASERAARAEAEHLNRSKDEFLAMLAHELRNPLAPVSSAAELLRLISNDPERVQHVSEIISRQIGHFTHLIDDLMDVSRVTRGLIELDVEPLDIKSVIATAIEQVRPMIEARQHKLTTQLTGDHAVVSGDRTRLVQVIANLLTNAAKYTPPEGTITLKVEAEQERVDIEVIDNGSGMDESLIPHVFDLFTQGTRELDRNQGGLGIGLALVKAIVNLHHGQVIAHSAGIGLGSIFTVSLPRLTARENLTEIPTPEKSSKQVNILLVDDNLDAAESLSMLLQMVGHKVRTASTAKDALNLPDLNEVDVFLLDIGLPDMSGYELARALRSIPALASKLLIALTGYGQPQDREQSHEAGFSHHLVKPVDSQQLLSILREVK